jgi:hypothetical protein
MTIRKTSEIKKDKINEGSSNFISIKNISGKPEWLKLRIDDLIKRIDQKKRVSKATKKVSLSLSAAEFESVVDLLERLQKTIFLESENRKLKKEINKLDKKLDNKAWNELIAIEWAKKAIPSKEAKLQHYREAAYRIGVKRPKRGRPVEHNPKEEMEFWNMAYKLIKDEQGSPPTTKQRKNIVEQANKRFEHLSYNATCQYLSEHGAKHLPWPKKSKPRKSKPQVNSA